MGYEYYNDEYTGEPRYRWVPDVFNATYPNGAPPVPQEKELLRYGPQGDASATGFYAAKPGSPNVWRYYTLTTTPQTESSDGSAAYTTSGTTYTLDQVKQRMPGYSQWTSQYGINEGTGESSGWDNLMSFIVPAVIGAGTAGLGGALGLGSAGAGALAGGVTSAATENNPLTGALLGGLGGFAKDLFTGTVPAAIPSEYADNWMPNSPTNIDTGAITFPVDTSGPTELVGTPRPDVSTATSTATSSLTSADIERLLNEKFGGVDTALNPLQQSISDLQGQYGSLGSSFQQQLADLQSQLSGQVSSNISPLQQSLADLKSQYSGLFDQLQGSTQTSLTPIQQTLADLQSQYGDLGSTFDQRLADLQTQLQGSTQTSLSPIQQTLADLQTQYGNLGGAFDQQLADLEHTLSGQVSSTFDPLQQSLADLKTQYGGLDSSFSQRLADLQSQLQGSTQSSLTGAIDPLQKALNDLQSKYGDLGSSFNQQLADLQTQLQGSTQTSLTGALDPLQKALTDLQSQYGDLGSTFNQQLTGLQNQLTGQVSSAIDPIQETLNRLQESLGNQATNQAQYQTGNALGMLGGGMDITDLLSGLGDTTADLGGSSIADLMSGLGDTTADLGSSSALQNLLSRAMADPLGSAATALKAAGILGSDGSITSRGAGLISGIASSAGQYLNANAARDAAQTTANAQIEAAKIAADAAKFRPVGVTTKFGKSDFTFDDKGNLKTAGYTLSPDMQALQNQLLGSTGGFLNQFTGSQAATAPMSTAAQRAMTLGNQYLSTDPQAQAAKYLAEQQALLQPGREREMAALENRLRQQGRLGLATGGTTTMGAANPEMEAYANAKRMQDLQLAAQATQGGMDYAKFGAGMVGTGSDLLKAMYGTQTAAFAPYQTALGGAQTIEGLGQNALNLGTQLGSTVTAANAAQGNLLAQGMQNSAQTMQQANAYSPWGGLLSGVGNSISNYQAQQNQQAQQQQQQQQNQALIDAMRSWGNRQTGSPI